MGFLLGPGAAIRRRSEPAVQLISLIQSNNKPQALLPLQTDPLLSSLYRQPKRPSSPSRQATKGSISSISALSPQHIDVRAVALRSFRDKVILPLAPRLKARLSMTNRQDNFQETPGYQQPRLQQMCVVLLALMASLTHPQAPRPGIPKPISNPHIFSHRSSTAAFHRRSSGS